MNTTMDRVKTLVQSALFAALIFVSITMLSIPNPLGGIIHFGDAFIFLAATMLPFPYALFTAAIGAGFANLALGGTMWIPFTIIIKPLMTLCFSNKGEIIFSSKRNYIAPVVAGLINLILYYLATVILMTLGVVAIPDGGAGTAALGPWIAPMAGVPGDMIQFAGSATFYFVIAHTFDRLKIKEVFFRYQSKKSTLS